MSSDAWLEPLLPEIRARSGGKPLLEVGCGEGLDTAILVRAGCRVIAIDRSETALVQAQACAPAAEFHCQDIRAPFPLDLGGAGVVVASLSLHYFSWDETVQLVERIRNVLGPGGLLLCRVNSTNDRNHGSVGFPELDKHYYSVAGAPKRFFDRADLELLFGKGWQVRTLVEETIHRYAMPKVVWRLFADVVA